MRKVRNGWTRNEDALAVAPGRAISFTKVDDGDEPTWFGAVTHQRNVVTVYPDDLAISLDLRVKSARELRQVIKLLQRAWDERDNLASPAPRTRRGKRASRRPSLLDVVEKIPASHGAAPPA
jgi:hypothetical protein